MLLPISDREKDRLYKTFDIIESDDEEKVKENFIWGVLDRYSRALDDDESLSLLTNKHLYNNDQPKFINFFNKVLNLNGNNQVIIVRCLRLLKEYKNLNYLKEKVEIAEYKQLLLLKKIIKSNFVKTDNKQLLNFFFKLMIREKINFDFFIPELNVTIQGNGELSLPIYATGLEDLRKLEQIAEECGLFIRDIE